MSPRNNFYAAAPCASSALLAAALLLAACDRAPTAPATAPSPDPAPTPAALSPRAPSTSDFPAFQGGGPLVGAAPDDLPTPLTLRWKYKTKGRAGFEAGPAIVGDTVFAADNKGTLHALNLADGALRWTYDTEESFVVTPAVAGNLVLLGDTLGTFHAVDRATGKKIWTFDAQAAIHASANIRPGQVLFGNDIATLYCLSLDGKQLWTAKAEDRINSAPAFSADTAFIAACDAKLRAISLADGKQRAVAEIPALAPGSPVLAGEDVLVATDQGHVVCFDARTLTEKWSYDQVENEAMVYATPAVTGNLVVVGARDHNVHAIHRGTGKQAWIFRTRGDVDASPLIAGNRVYVGSQDKHFYVLDLNTGKQLQDFPTLKPIAAAAAIARGSLLIADTGGTLYCLKPQ